MDLKDVAILVSLATTAAGGTYWANDHFGTKDDVKVAGAKADYALDKHSEYVLAQINQLEAKVKRGVATAADLDQLRYLREELQRLRQMRRGG